MTLGNLIETGKDVNQKGVVSKYVYDAKGNRTQEMLSYGGSQIGTSTNKYNQDGFISESIQGTYEGLRRTVIYQYTKDSKGNYITKTTSMGTTYNGMNNKMEANEIVERVIEYY